MLHASLGEINNLMQASGVQCGKETGRGAQVFVGAPGVHLGRGGADVGPSLGQETLELSLEG